MAISKINAEAINLADTFGFTGTEQTPDYIALSNITFPTEPS